MILEEEFEREGGRGQRVLGIGQRGWLRGEDFGKSFYQWGVWIDNRGFEVGFVLLSSLVGEVWRVSFFGYSVDVECYDIYRIERGQSDVQMARVYGFNWSTVYIE